MHGPLALALFTSVLAQPSARPAIAVFEVELDGSGLSGVSTHLVTESLVAALSGAGERVVDRTKVERLVEKEKKESRRCEAACRLDVARTLAVPRFVVARIGAMRGRCQTKLELVDSASGRVEAVASGQGACTVDGVSQALRDGLPSLRPSGGAPSADTPEGVVRAFMELTLDNWRADRANDAPRVKATERSRIAMLSPAKLRESGRSTESMEINDYAFESYQVLEVKGETITVRGFNNTNGWSRTMWFTTQVEGGRRVIVPSRVAEYVDPWSRLDATK